MCFLGRFFCLYRLMTRFGSRSTCWTPADFCLCRTAREANSEHISWHNLFRVQSWCPARTETIINWPLHFHPSSSHLEAEIFPVCWRRSTLSTVGMDRDFCESLLLLQAQLQAAKEHTVWRQEMSICFSLNCHAMRVAAVFWGKVEHFPNAFIAPLICTFKSL